MRKIRIALAQIFCLDGDRAGNFIRIENAIQGAKAGEADIVCFPETAILGWVNCDAHKRAFPVPGRDSERLSVLAKKYEIFLCVGLAEKDGKKLYDSAVLIDKTGRILLKHRKINILTELMNPPYTPGNEVNAVDTGFGRIGLLICADTHSDEILELMAKLKPDLLLVPYGYAEQEENWPEHGKELERVVKETGRKTGAVVVGPNLVGEITKGPWKGRIFGGHSVAADKNGKILTVGADRDREIKIFSVKTGSSSLDG